MTDPTADELEELTDVLADLRDEVRGLRQDVQSERRGRRLTMWLAAVVVGAVLVAGAGWIADLRAEAAQSCASRGESRADVRAMGVALTSYAVEEAGVSPARAVEIIEGAERIAIETLPPPDC